MLHLGEANGQGSSSLPSPLQGRMRISALFFICFHSSATPPWTFSLRETPLLWWYEPVQRRLSAAVTGRFVATGLEAPAVTKCPVSRDLKPSVFPTTFPTPGWAPEGKENGVLELKMTFYDILSKSFIFEVDKNNFILILNLMIHKPQLLLYIVFFFFSNYMT